VHDCCTLSFSWVSSSIGIAGAVRQRERVLLLMCAHLRPSYHKGEVRTRAAQQRHSLEKKKKGGS